MLFDSRSDPAALPEAQPETESDVWITLDLRSDAERQPSSTGAGRDRTLEVVEGSGGGWGQRTAAAGRRLFDIGFAVLALVISLPVMIVIIAAIRLSSPGPAVYKHRRVGLRGRAFDCLKFRTMVMDADKVLQDLLDGDPELRMEFEEKFKLTDDPRVTGIGKLLRKTSLDELPQFWNVLMGDMGVVGPRPLVHEETKRYGPHLPLVLSVRPGLTGLWQVSGRNDTTYEERVDLDREYVLKRNIGTDLRIIAKTVQVMVRRENGAY